MTTTVAIGVATKPYPHFRLPGKCGMMRISPFFSHTPLGWNQHSIAYFSTTGCKYFSNPFHDKPYGPPLQQGDVLGVGYRHRSGTIFFTRNGRRLDDACMGLRWNLFPTIGANGPCQIHVNFGQLGKIYMHSFFFLSHVVRFCNTGFVFVEANIKKWGLAPAHGTLAPPPAYGLEAGSLLLERGDDSRTTTIINNNEQQPLLMPQQHSSPLYPPPPEYNTFS